ncbi:SNARE domain-containing protein [Rhizoctonia solani AG-1 IA]|uniref:SNARE domain-containing protein n=1 Tax=Thanatephorus cucumeris (strain AG1-IA) TaxID=983506 RepID=L8WJ59_THACA|nr:SNARE domain-containing protein [Rhizoctonia solani AG-1 IA]
MSFADLERGQGGFQSSSALVPTSPSDAEFLGLQKSLSVQIFKINSNVQGILKLVDQLGTARDTGTVRKGHELTETTRELIKRGTDDLKTLSTLSTKHFYRRLPTTSRCPWWHSSALKRLAQRDKGRWLMGSNRRWRTMLTGELGIPRFPENQHDNTRSAVVQWRAPLNLKDRSKLSKAELAHQESLIQDREAEIREIETGIHELNEIFRDLGTLVTEQGTMLDTIETNVDSVALDTRDAAQQLEQASEYQRKAGRRAACLMLVVVIVICVVLVAVRIVILSLEFPWFSTRVRLVDVSQINDN